MMVLTLPDVPVVVEERFQLRRRKARPQVQAKVKATSKCATDTTREVALGPLGLVCAPRPQLVRMHVPGAVRRVIRVATALREI